jgi:SAM-dependent methyltransferase
VAEPSQPDPAPANIDNYLLSLSVTNCGWIRGCLQDNVTYHLKESHVVLRALIDANIRLSRATNQRLKRPILGDPLWGQFELEADTLIRDLPDGSTVLDLGGGRHCAYAKAVEPPGRVRLVAVDISPEELAANTDVAETCIADVAADIPLPDASADVILSCTLLEHVEGVAAAAQHMARVLRVGGVTMHLVPCRYSLFGTAARVLPFGPTLRLLHVLRPETKGVVEFPVVYDDCWPQALERDFRNAGFSHVDTRIIWRQTDYFEPVYPLFLLSLAYEWLIRLLHLRQLASYTVVRAVR